MLAQRSGGDGARLHLCDSEPAVGKVQAFSWWLASPVLSPPACPASQPSGAFQP